MYGHPLDPTVAYVGYAPPPSYVYAAPPGYAPAGSYGPAYATAYPPPAGPGVVPHYGGYDPAYAARYGSPYAAPGPYGERPPPEDDRRRERSRGRRARGGHKAREPEPEAKPGPYPFSGKFGKGGRGGKRAGVGCNIYVYNIPSEWDEDELARHFHHVGELVSVAIMRKPDTDESRGFGFVGFSEAEHVRDAILAMDGFCAQEDKYLNVNPKKGEEDLLAPFSDIYPPAAKLGELPPSGQRAPPGGNVYVHSIPLDWTEHEFHRHFIHYGGLSSVKIMRREEEGQQVSRGFGFIGFVNPVSALRAVVGMSGFAAAPGRFLVVQIKQGEEEAAEKVRAAVEIVDPSALPKLQPIEAKNGAAGGPAGTKPNLKRVPPGANLYVARVPSTWTDTELNELFSPFGNIVSVALVPSSEGQHKAYGFVGYDNADSARMAILNLNGAKVAGKALIVKLKDDKSKPF